MTARHSTRHAVTICSLLLAAWLITRQKETPVYLPKGSLLRLHDPGYLVIK